MKSNEYTISSIYGQKERSGNVGLEIEVESKESYQLPAEPGGVWLTKAEGSLRNGLEYYTRQPLPVGESLKRSIQHLVGQIDTDKVDMSIRTSVHVHVNVQKMTPLQVWTAAVAYWMLEGPLLRFCGDHRIGNLFCLGLEHAEGILKLCERDLKSKKRPFSYFAQDLSKYGSQNLSAIQRFGSIEYRAMRGTLDVDLIVQWCRILHSIVENSRFFGSPAEVLDYYISSEKNEFLNVLLPGDLSNPIKEQKDYSKIIEESAMILADFAYLPDDWKRWEEDRKKKVERSETKSKSSIRAAFEAVTMPNSTRSRFVGSTILDTFPQPIPQRSTT